MTAPICSIDFETRSQVDLPKVGVYKYVEHPTTDVWCMAWAFDFGPISLWRRGQTLPKELQEHARAGGMFRAWNAAFERIVWNGILTYRQGWPPLPVEQTWCTQAQALTQGLPAALDKAAEALGINMRKDMDGRKLMLKMCRPRLVNVDGSVIWWDDETMQLRLGDYCMQDIATERAIGSRLRPMPDEERAIYLIDQKINERGMLLDHDLVHAALTVVGKAAARLDHDVRELTKGMVANTRKRNDLLKWLALHADLDDDLDSIDKYTLVRLLKRDDLTDAVRAVLTIRQEASKSSTAKLAVMQRASNRDGRIRGVLRYYGARQTGRWAGHLLQPHNFPRGHLLPADLEATVEDVKAADRTLDLTGIEALHGPPLDLIASLLRGCVIAARGKKLLVADWNAIEARILAWLASAKIVLHLFRTGSDPYKVMASHVYHKAVADIDDGERFLGKTLVLSCGYQCGWRNLQNRIAKEGVVIDDYDAQLAIETYRATNPEITELWRAMDEAAKNAIENPGTVYQHRSGLRFGVKGSVLYMKLPSGRFLAYLHPKIETVVVEGDDGPYEREQITFTGVNPITYQWCRMYTYGGKLTENATQALARDVLAAGILRVEAAGYPVVLHVHDEIVSEVGDGDLIMGDKSLTEFIALLNVTPEWIGDCPLKVAGWSGPRYRK